MSDCVVECILVGAITGEIVKKSVQETRELTEAIIDEGKKPVLLIDMEKLESQNSGARSEAKQLVKLGLEKIAVYGANATLSTIGQYIARISGMQTYTTFFRTRSRALKWLKTPRQKQRSEKERTLRLATLLIASMSGGVLIGWMLSSDMLVALSGNFKAMNPVTALNFVLIAVALYLCIRLKKSQGARRTFIALIGAWLVFYGSVVTIGYVFGFSTGIDTWLFTDKLGTLGSVTAKASSITGGMFIVFGMLLLLARQGLDARWRLYAFRFLGVVLSLGVLMVLTGYGFQVLLLIDLAAIPMPLNSAVEFGLSFAVLVGIIYKPGLYPIATGLFKSYWQGMSVFIGILLITSVVWRQIDVNIDTSKTLQSQRIHEKTVAAVEERVDAYVNVLRGFKAFFESSDNVQAAEYQHYFNGTGIQQNYPGFNAISFIRYIRPGQMSVFETEMRSQPKYEDFTAQNNTPGDHFILTYLVPVTTTTPGTDIGALSGRKEAFETARDSGNPTASGVVTFASQSGAPEEGFLITIPIYKKDTPTATVADRRQNSYGFVNAVFRNDAIFNDVFKSLDLEEGVAFRITSSTGKVIHEANTMGSSVSFSRPAIESNINVAGQTWNIAMQTSQSYGMTGVAGAAPWITLGSGIVFATLAALLVSSLSKRREQALLLASSMTEDLNNERNMAESVRQKDEAILASIGDAVFAIDLNQKITLFNPAAGAMSGYSQQEAIGAVYHDILPFVSEKTGQLDNAFIKKALDGKMASMKTSTMLRRKDGSFVAVADSAAPIYDLDKKLIGVIVVFRDVSKERALDRAKSEFVSLASHQLRTPLSAINWYSEMLLDGDAGDLNDDQREYTHEIYEGNKRMVELVDSLLNVSRLEVGKLKNEPKETSLIELENSLSKELRTSVLAKKMIMKNNIEKHLPNVFADPKLLRMILQNLLSNAVKYTAEKGTVVLTMRLAKSEELSKAKLRHNQQYVYISVADNGYGIPLEQQGKIFEKLFRADNVRKLDVEGTGLGLYIIKEVALKLGGAIWFDSDEGKGTTFHVIIPVKTRPS